MGRIAVTDRFTITLRLINCCVINVVIVTEVPVALKRIQRRMTILRNHSKIRRKAKNTGRVITLSFCLGEPLHRQSVHQLHLSYSADLNKNATTNSTREVISINLIKIFVLQPFVCCDTISGAGSGQQ